MLLGETWLETKMHRRNVPLLAICLLLGGCQPATYDILAVVKGADLVFVARGSGIWPFRNNDGISAEWLEVRNRDEIVWAIEADRSRPGCKPAGKMPPFPLVYGRTPACYIEKVAARPIRRGIIHRIDGEGDRYGTGLFRVDGEAFNLDLDDLWKEVQNWPSLPDPRFRPGRDNAQPSSDTGNEAGIVIVPGTEPRLQPSRNIAAAPAAAESKTTSDNRP
jgi:hypothetical protein